MKQLYVVTAKLTHPTDFEPLVDRFAVVDAPNLDSMLNFASMHGFKADIDVQRIEISETSSRERFELWVVRNEISEDDDPKPALTTDRYDARMNEIEHAQRTAEKRVNDKLDKLVNLITHLAAPVREVSHEIVAVEKRERQERDPRRSARRGATPEEFIGDPEHMSNSMAIRGNGAGSMILELGFDPEGKPTINESKPTLAGDTLKRGT